MVIAPTRVRSNFNSARIRANTGNAYLLKFVFVYYHTPSSMTILSLR